MEDNYFNLGKRRHAEEEFESKLINENKINQNGYNVFFESFKLIFRFIITLILCFIISLKISFENIDPLDDVLVWVSILSLLEFILDFINIICFVKV